MIFSSRAVRTKINEERESIRSSLSTIQSDIINVIVLANYVQNEIHNRKDSKEQSIA